MRPFAAPSLLALLLTLHPAWAGDAYRPADGDLVKVTVYGRTDLSGIIRVQEGDRLPLPLLGSVPLKNQTADELEKSLAAAFQQRLGTPLSVTVEVQERRPVYVLGMVNNPGAFPHKSGMTAMQALAIAGGLRRMGSDSDQRLVIDVYRETGSYGANAEALKAGLAERARYEALRDGSAKVAMPQKLLELAGKEDAETRIRGQQQILQAYLADQQRQADLFEAQISSSGEEINAYQQQLAALDQQTKLVTDELARVQKLRDTGLGLESRVFEMKRDLTSLAGSKRGAIAALVRARQSAATARSELAALETARADAIHENLARLAMEIGQAEAKASASRGLLAALGETPAGLQNAPDAEPLFQITRTENGKPVTIAATALTPVEPGDVLQIVQPADNLQKAARW